MDMTSSTAIQLAPVDCFTNGKPFVTGHAKIRHVGTKYTLSNEKSYLRMEVAYSPVNCITKPIKC